MFCKFSDMVTLDVAGEVRLSDACAICCQATRVCHTELVARQLQRVSVTIGACVLVCRTAPYRMPTAISRCTRHFSKFQCCCMDFARARLCARCRAVCSAVRWMDGDSSGCWVKHMHRGEQGKCAIALST